jgi:hypothetical protein
MSEVLSAAAAVMGLPESIVERSAAARAEETGMSVEEVLTAWAGGETVASVTPSVAEPEAHEAEAEPVAGEEESPTPETAAAPVMVEVPAAPMPEPVSAAPGRPPTLVGSSDNPMTVVMASVGLFLAVFMIAIVGSSTAQDEPGARTSNVAYSAAAEDGRGLYLSLGCAACHTQMVRPIASDVGLGPVTVSDMNQIPGTRRFGPDLSDVANRLSRAQIEAVLGGFGGHGTTSLSSSDLDHLVSYLMETAGVTE